MAKKSKGFPGRTVGIADLLEDEDLTYERVAAYIICSLRALRREIKSASMGEELPRWWIEQTMDTSTRSDVPLEIAASMRDCEAALTKGRAPTSYGRRTLGRLWAEIKKEVDCLITGEEEWSEEVSNEVDAEAVEEFGLKVVFCWDEAANLVDVETDLEPGRSCFGIIRRVMSACKYGLFGLVVDTNPTLTQQLSPSRDKDSTYKVLQLEYDIFQPVWLVGVADCGEREIELRNAEVVPRDFFRLGRPLWGAFLDCGCTEDDLLELARKKLLAGADFASSTPEFAAGVLGCSIGLEVTSWSETAEQAVACHMMTAAWISPDRKQVEITSAAEPVLSSAAAIYLAEEENLVHVLGELAYMCKNGVVQGGPRGEIVVRLLLLLAMHAALKKKGLSQKYLGFVSIREYLKALFGKVPEGLSANVDLDAELLFNAFSPTDVGAYQDGLMHKFMARCRALQCRRREFGIDGRLPTASGGHKLARVEASTSASTPLFFSSINYRANCWKDDTISDAVKKMESLESSLNLVLQVGSGKSIVSVEGKDKKTIVALGMSTDMFPFLSKDVLIALERITNVNSGLLEKFDDPVKKRILKDVLPLSF